MSDIVQVLLDSGLGNPRNAEAVEDLDDKGERAKGGECPAGVERSMVGQVVENTAQDVKVGELENGRRRVDEDGADDVRHRLLVVVGAYFSQGEADGEEDAGKGVEGGDFEAAVFTACC